MKLVVTVADMRVSKDPDDLLITHALGSCLGVSAYDASAGVGGLLHVMLPQASVNPEKARDNPYMFVDTALPAFFRELYAVGAAKPRLSVKVAGGASQGAENDRFAIGKRNYLMLKKIFWTNGVLIDAQDVGGSTPRTMSLELASGRVKLSIAGQERDL